MKKVLVFGSDGQLGKCLRDAYCEHGGKIEMKFYNHNSCDILQFDSLNKLVEEEKPDFIVNCAAYTNVAGAEECMEKAKLAYEVNCLGAVSLANVCREHNVNLIHISTDYVYDGKEGYYQERYPDECVPVNTYGMSKLLGEEAIEMIMRGAKSRYLIIRTSWLYSKYNNNFFRKVADTLYHGGKVEAVYDEVGCPTYAPNLANFIVNILESDFVYPNICQYSDLGVATRYDIAKEIERLLGSRLLMPPQQGALVVPISSFENEGYRVPRPQICVMSKDMAMKMGEIRHWKKGIAEFVAEYLKEESNNPETEKSGD